ncbi:MAG: glycosyltransferase family 4 protein [Caldiserica bacterium]|nr:glycosyltransferase family 4 protein [Caldisericota bacterium]
MKILQIISSKDTGGGSQEHTRILSLGLQGKGHRVKIICRPGSLVEAYRKDGLEVYPLELRDKRKAIREIVD